MNFLKTIGSIYLNAYKYYVNSVHIFFSRMSIIRWTLVLGAHHLVGVLSIMLLYGVVFSASLQMNPSIPEQLQLPAQHETIQEVGETSEQIDEQIDAAIQLSTSTNRASVIHGNIIVYSDPNIESSTVSSLQEQYQFSIVNRTSSLWWYIESNEISGWIYVKSLTITEKDASTSQIIVPSTDSQSVQSKTGYINTQRLNVRSGPGTEYSVITTLVKGDVVEITGNSDKEWVEIVFNGTTGWLNSKYIVINR